MSYTPTRSVSSFRSVVGLVVWFVILSGYTLVACGDEWDRLLDKTLVAWVSPANLTQRGGSVLTINDTTMDRFDGIVFGEIEPGVWMPGSNGFSRTNRDQGDWPRETIANEEFVQLAIVYEGQSITVYRDGEIYARYAAEGEPYAFTMSTAVLIGPRHLRPNVETFFGKVREARIYDQPLNGDTIAAMRPGAITGDLKPWAWWDFATTGTYDKAGRFNRVTLTGGAHLDGECLVLAGERPSMLATIVPDDASGQVSIPGQWTKDDPAPPAVIQSARLLREKMLDDPYRPRYHFCVPEDMGMPGDPNGCFYTNGRYHLMYLYNRSGSGFSWGHISSADLINWRHHPDAIGPGDGDEGCFSGGGFVDDDGSAYLTYWMLWGDKGIGIARSTDRDYSQWRKFKANPVIRSTEWGITETVDSDGERVIYGSADPSNIWKKDGKYYVLTGNLLVLNKYGRAADSPREMRGDRLYLFESDDLKAWRYKGVFYDRRPGWTDDSEDNMCPSFLPLPADPDSGRLSDKHLLLFISHNKGCQYYIGEYDREHDRFHPTAHGRMTWADNTYFAPEALIDGRGRQIMWAWLLDNPSNEQARGWSGVYGLPRSLWLGDDGTLRMRPVEELKTLRHDERRWSDLSVSDGQTRWLDGIVGTSCELEITVPAPATGRVGLKVRASRDGAEETLLYYDAQAHELCFDATKSGVDGRRIVERAPLTIPTGESLKLRVFVDQSVVEIYANDRQAICRRVYPGRADSVNVALFSDGGEALFAEVKAWEMMPANPY